MISGNQPLTCIVLIMASNRHILYFQIINMLSYFVIPFEFDISGFDCSTVQT